MRYFVALGPEDAPPAIVDVRERGDGSLAVVVDGAPLDVDVAMVGGRLDARFDVRVGSRVVDVAVEATPSGYEAFVIGRHTPLRVESERARGAEPGAGLSSAGGKAAGAVVRSPMPGRVVRILVSAGQTVESGQGVVVLEAMKMENEVRARSAGRVADVHVAPGATVEANAKLVTLGPA